MKCTVDTPELHQLLDTSQFHQESLEEADIVGEKWVLHVLRLIFDGDGS